MPEETSPECTVPNEPLDDFDITIPGNNEAVSYFDRNLREVVNIHQDAFKKLLYQQEEIPLELGELFEQVGNRYLDFSVEISDIWRLNQSRLNSARKPLE